MGYVGSCQEIKNKRDTLTSRFGYFFDVQLCPSLEEREICSGQFAKEVQVDWLSQIPPEIVQYQKASREFSKAIARIYEVSQNPPYFVVVDRRYEIRLEDLLQSRSEQMAGVLKAEEALLLVMMCQEFLATIRTHPLPARGFEFANIYCSLDADNNIQAFQIWGAGWKSKGEDAISAACDIVQRSLSGSPAMDERMESLLQKSASLDEFCNRLREFETRLREKAKTTASLPDF